jgi:two-component system, sensor histidine kinase LadS
MLLRIYIFGILTVLFLNEVVAQADTVTISTDSKLQMLTYELEYFNDETSTIICSDVVSKYNEGHFYTLGETVGNFSDLKGTLWFRFAVKNVAKEPVILNIDNIFIEHISIYKLTATGSIHLKETGHLTPFISRDIPSNHYSLVLSEGDEDDFVIYGSIRAESGAPLYLPMQVGTLKQIVALTRKSEFVSIAVLGALLVMFMYNLCLLVILGDRLYLYYAIYNLASIGTVLWFTGFAFEWFWPDRPLRNHMPWMMGIFYFAQLLFVNQLLRVRKIVPILFKISTPLYVVAVGIFGLAMIPGFPSASVIMAEGILVTVYFSFVSVTLLLKGEKVVKLFLLGWFPILLIMGLNILMWMGIIPYSLFFDVHGVEVALCWELVIFSFGLGYRYDSIRKEKVELQQENIRIIKEQKSLLRRMVFEQTEEIMAQNDQLLRNQEEIKLQNERLETQNKAYGRLKEMILRQNQELESAVAKRTIQLAQSNEELKRHFHQLEQFSFIAAHNLRAPVARILGLTSILDRDNIRNPDNIAILDKIVISAKDLDMIIHDLGGILDAQKNSGEKVEPINVYDLIIKILNRFEADIERGGIKIQIKARVKVIVAIPAYLDSIITNLISNSIKYKSETAEPIITIVTDDVGIDWSIVVEDNGLGFDSKLFSRKLFEPFQRFHTHKDGKGLGMFLVKTQVMAMKGSISLASQPNVGTLVEVSLPKLPIPEFAG